MVSKGIFAGISLILLVAGIVIGFLIGYFTPLGKCDNVAIENEENGPDQAYNHAPGPCQLAKGIDVGSEDMVVLPSGLVLITSGMTSFLPRDRPDLLSRRGSLKLFDFNDVDGGAADIPIVNEDAFNYADFNPHGMSVWIDHVTGRIYVFVVNHNYVPDMIETIERFEFDERNRALRHLETIADDENMFLVNNVIATGADTFYYTNFLSSRVPEEMDREMAEKLPTGGIAYYDGDRGNILVEGMRSPNGITMSPDGRYVYVAGFGDGGFYSYKRDANNGLSFHKRYQLHPGIDNLDADGDYVWIGSHPDHGKLIQYLTDPNEIQSPSQALRLRLADGEVTDIVEVYMNDGSEFSGCTVAVHWQGHLLLGSVASKALYCEAKYVG